MIHVDRDRVGAPPSLAAAGVAERDDAIVFHGDDANAGKTYPFKAYKSPDVRAALNELFYEKCAYCESRYRATAPVDIEHFRPKGAISIEGKRSKPGYYWLAAEWDNLLPSCIDCNRARTHPFAEDDDDDDDDVFEVAGKENQFPLMDEARRARTPADFAHEQGFELLLHPCLDFPEEHLDFKPNGLVWARDESRKGVESIRVFALLRKPLKEERRDQLLRIARQMRTLLFFIERIEDDPGDADAAAEFKRLIVELREERDPRRPYSGMARQFIADFERSLTDKSARAFVEKLLTEVSSSQT